MSIIDTHAHIFPPKIEQIATNAIKDFYDRPSMSHAGSAEELLLSGKKAGVDRFLVFSTATTSQQVTPINDFIISECSTHEEFVGAGTMHIDYPDAADEIDRIYSLGIKGIKFHPDFQKFDIDDDRLFPVFAHMGKKDMFMITHAGDNRYDYSHPEKIARIAAMFPKLRIVAAHFGGWMMWETARRVLNAPNIYVDTSSTFGFGGVHPVREGLRAFDRKHIFFGCDFPMWDHEAELRNLAVLGLEDAFMEDILYNNFAEFYGL